MKIMNLLTISLCAIALTMTVGCASDDDGGTTNTNTTETDASAPADDAAAPADDAAAPADDAAPVPADDAAAPADDAAAPADDAAAPAGEGACTNDADMAIVGNPDNDIEGDAGDFGVSCLSAEDVGACTTEKLLEKYDLTPDCGACFAGIVGCTVDKCLLKCAADPSADACVCCRETEGCTPAFYECTGLPNDNPPDCE